MGLSILIAKIISVIYITAGIAVLFRQLNFDELTSDLMKSPALTFISGCVAIILGVILLEHHNIWVKNWTVMITLLSWIFLTGGIAIIVFPKSLSVTSRLLMKYLKYYSLIGLFMICFGLLFGYFGFLHGKI